VTWFIAGVVAAVGIAILGGAWWLWWRLPKRQVDRLRLTIRDPKARADVEDNFRKTITQLLGGGAVLIGAGAAYYGTLQTLQVNKDQAQRSEQAAHDLLISNQVSKGFEQLGSDKIVVRLGGIYALEGVMNTSEQYHLPVLEALSAFVRDGTRTGKSDGPPDTDIQAALTVIGRRADIWSGSPDFANAHIPKALLTRADLTGANLVGTDLNGAQLMGAVLNGANLTGANLKGAMLLGASLNNAILDYTNLTGADLYLARLTGDHVGGIWSNPHGPNLTNADLSVANLTGAFLPVANLNGANLIAAKLAGAKLIASNLNGAKLGGADLTNTDLGLADLINAKITQAQLDKACGTNAKLDPGLTLKPCPK
jgi:uncharacterized protein YjbI with pentapeptide repeats